MSRPESPRLDKQAVNRAHPNRNYLVVWVVPILFAEQQADSHHSSANALQIHCSWVWMVVGVKHTWFAVVSENGSMVNYKKKVGVETRKEDQGARNKNEGVLTVLLQTYLHKLNWNRDLVIQSQPSWGSWRNPLITSPQGMFLTNLNPTGPKPHWLQQVMHFTQSSRTGQILKHQHGLTAMGGHVPGRIPIDSSGKFRV